MFVQSQKLGQNLIEIEPSVFAVAKSTVLKLENDCGLTIRDIEV